VASPDAYRAAGLDYNAVLPGTQVQIVRRPDGRSVLRLVSDRAVQEPFVDVVLDISWANGRLSREYTMLFDPPSNLRARAPEAVTAPVISAPPPAASPLAAAPAVQAAPRPAPAPRAPAAPLPTDGTIVVRPGDSLSRIAERNLPAGVSLDQMLVALYRNNGDAFLNNNMNLLRAGAKLKLPSDATATAAAEARQVVRAHSADFDNARRGIATAAPKLPAEPETTAKGVVKAQVQETKPTAPAGDRLTLSKPVPPQVPAPVPAPAPTASKPGDNVAALSKTVDDLKKLSEAAKGGTPVPAATEASAAPAISLPASVAEAASVASAPPVVAPASKPAAVVPPPAPVVAESGGLLGFLTSPLGAALGAVVVLGLGFLGWRTTRKPKPMGSRETMFGESKLQPDSFFGVTGGQRVDTRDGASGVSSMSYSLSQLDAHGDVDPVAEADVYLAYGRDLQAEEILKEALRGTPERMAIRLKLLEVYAKRRDVRGCEQLATQLYADTKGTGDDWEKAQELGRSVDPENRLYQPGGGPRSMFDDEAPRPEPMNASTLPAAVSAFSASAAAAMSPTDEGPPSLLDLDLDLGVDVNTAATQSMPAQPAAAPAPMTMDFTVPDAKPAEAADSGMDFKLDDLDFEASTQNQRLQEMTERQGLTDIGDLGDTTAAGKLTGVDSLIDAVQGLADDDSDPLTRQLELAEEFRQIGDVEGARDVLQELINQVGSGPLYDKAKAMLDLLR
jgi:pilus assembly protein FimV